MVRLLWSLHQIRLAINVVTSDFINYWIESLFISCFSKEAEATL